MRFHSTPGGDLHRLPTRERPHIDLVRTGDRRDVGEPVSAVRQGWLPLADRGRAQPSGEAVFESEEGNTPFRCVVPLREKAVLPGPVHDVPAGGPRAEPGVVGEMVRRPRCPFGAVLREGKSLSGR